jgi:hypothetical protein
MKRERGRVGRRAPRNRPRRPRPETAYAPWRQFTRNQQEVARRLTAGQITGVTVTGWSYVAQFLSFLDLVGYCALLNLEGRGFVRVMIPIAQLVLTYHLKVLLGIGSINRVPTQLFREWALLQLIGYTTTQLQSGFCERGHLAAGPMHRTRWPMRWSGCSRPNWSGCSTRRCSGCGRGGVSAPAGATTRSTRAICRRRSGTRAPG